MATKKHAELELRDVPYTEPQKTIRLATRLVSSKVGLIRSIGGGIHRAQDPRTFALGIAAPDLSHYSDILNSSKAGGGGESLEMALAATIGEAVERYCMLYYDKSTMVGAPYREVADDAVSPEMLRLYSLEQVERKGPNVRLTYFDEDTKINWVWGYSLTDKCPRLVPATLVYLQYALDEGEHSIGRNASTGLAAGGTIEEAILTGLFEVVERDAHAIAWLHRKVGPVIRIDDPGLQEMLKKRFFITHPSVDLKIYDITLDIPIPSVLGVMRRPTEFGPVLCVSSVTRLNPKEVIRKCLREIGQGVSYFRFLRNQLRDWEPAPDFSDLTTFDQHCTLYVKRPELVAPAMAFTEEVTEEVALSEIPDRSTGRVRADIERCIEMLRGIGKEVIVVDVTTPDIEDVGLKVVRVMVPGLVPMHGNHNYPYLGVKRLYEIPRKMGWEKSGGDSEAGLNPWPHPFP
jgi:ribosomal protein S12 methylthiotransferase accessory factor